jgi:hypothetical protein
MLINFLPQLEKYFNEEVMNDAIFDEKKHDEMKKFKESVKGDNEMEYRSNHYNGISKCFKGRMKEYQMKDIFNYDRGLYHIFYDEYRTMEQHNLIHENASTVAELKKMTTHGEKLGKKWRERKDWMDNFEFRIKHSFEKDFHENKESKKSNDAVAGKFALKIYRNCPTVICSNASKWVQPGVVAAA